MLRSYKFWFGIGLVVVLIICCATNAFGLNIDAGYLTSIISVCLSVLITLGIINKDLPQNTKSLEIKKELDEKINEFEDNKK